MPLPFPSRTETKALRVSPGGSDPGGKLSSSAPMKGGPDDPPPPPPPPHEESPGAIAPSNASESARKYLDRNIGRLPAQDRPDSMACWASLASESSRPFGRTRTFHFEASYGEVRMSPPLTMTIFELEAATPLKCSVVPDAC